MLGVVHPSPAVAYSDAEWTAHHPPLLPSRGLGGCILMGDDYVACSAITPTEILFSLAPRQTQIIPLELIAAVGLIYTFHDRLRGQDLIFFIDNQSVIGALTKGSSNSRDIQLLSTGFHAMCAQLGCRAWLEWVPSECNPADMLSRDHKSEDEILDLFNKRSMSTSDMILPAWTNQHAYDRIDKILESIRDMEAPTRP